MSNEWFEIAYINFAEAILHGQMVGEDGKEVEVRKVLSDEQKAIIIEINERHRDELNAVLRSMAS